MGQLSPAAVLYDVSGNPVAVTLDGSVYKLETFGKLRRADGTVVNPATEDGNLASIKAKTDAIPTDPAKESGKLTTIDGHLDVNLSTRALETGGNLAALAGKDFSTQTTLAALLTAFNAEDFASETKLELVRAIVASIKDADGIKKITDALPVGDNIVGRIKISDGSEVAAVTPSLRLRVDPRSVAKGLVYTRLTSGGGSEALNINGSGTPVVFTWNPGDADVEGMELVIVAEEPTIAFGTTFFGVTGLANGFLIEGKSEDVAFPLGNAQYTRDFFHLAPSGGIDLYAASPDIMRVMISLSGLVFKKSGTYISPDYIRITVRDNISSLNYLKAEIHGIKIEA